MQSTLKEDDLNSFYESDLSSLIQLKQSTKELYKWQSEAIKYFFDNKCKAIFEVPTGTGKTIMGIELMKEIWKQNPEAYFLIVVPKNVILETGWYKELYDAGISLKDIGVYYGSIKEYAKVTITNMQNLDTVAFNIFEGILLDECHNYGTTRIMDLINNAKEKGWKYMVGLTATLERQDGKHWAIQKMFNYNVFQYSSKEALTDNVLNPFEVVEVMIQLDNETREEYDKITNEINYMIARCGGYIQMMKSSGKNSALAKMNERKQMVNNYYKKFEIVCKICKKHNGEKIIVFNEYNTQTSKLYWQLLDYNIKSCVFHSDVPPKEREQHLIDFRKDKYNVILTSRVLDEGYNVKNLQCCIISAGNSTNRQMIQRIGRVLRKQEGKLARVYLLVVKNTIEDKYAEEKRKLLQAVAENYQIINEEQI